MRTEIIVAGVLVASAIIGAKYMDQRSVQSAPTPAVATVTPAAPQRLAVTQNYWGEEVRIAAAVDNQFYVDVEINRESARFLVDTGASFVALRDSDARKSGIFTTYADYTYPVRTANGETKAAYVTLDRVEIGGIRIEGVKAFILPDEQLAINLLGMSFLSRLESVEARAGELVLRG